MCFANKIVDMLYAYKLDYWYELISSAYLEKQHADILKQCKKYNIPICDYKVDIEKFLMWCKKFEFEFVPPASIISDKDSIIFLEKKLEFFISEELGLISSNMQIADIGSAQSLFAMHLAEDYGCKVFSIDPGLCNISSPHENITYISKYISQVQDIYNLDLAILQCSFEMFSPEEMRALIHFASQALKIGGKLIVLPLYINSVRVICSDSRATVPHHYREIGCQTYRNVKIKDFWGLSWVEILSVPDIAMRLNMPKNLKFSLYKMENVMSIDSRLFLNYAGIWEKIF